MIDHGNGKETDDTVSFLLKRGGVSSIDLECESVDSVIISIGMGKSDFVQMDYLTHEIDDGAKYAYDPL